MAVVLEYRAVGNDSWLFTYILAYDTVRINNCCAALGMMPPVCYSVSAWLN